MEIELKFKFPAEQRPGIEGMLSAMGFSQLGKTTKTDTVYFDTPDLALSGAGFSLRVRHAGRSYTQTLKSLENTGGLALQRFEREWARKSHAPDLVLLDGTPVSAVFASRGRPRVAAVFETHIDRAIYEIGLDDPATIELAIDEGEIKAGNAIEPVHELELELKDGSPAALYRFALELHAGSPLSIETESKAARGFRLRSERLPEAHKSRQVALADDVTAEDALRLIIESGLSQFIANLPAVSLDGDGEGVHQARVAIRRLRSALVLFNGHLEAHAAARFEKELRHYGRVFGAARDWDVFVLETIPRASDNGSEKDWLSLLLPPAESLRRKAHGDVERLIAGDELTGFVLALRAWSADELWIEAGRRGKLAATAPLRDLAPEMLDRLEARVLKRAQRIARQSEEELHALRKSFKKLRYAAEFFSDLYRHKATKRYRQACEGVQEILGSINDTAATDTLASRIGERAESAVLAPSIGILERWTSSSRAGALKRLPAAWDQFRSEKPFWR